jgi:hypothetical protein
LVVELPAHPVFEQRSCAVASPRVATVAGPSLLTLACPSFLAVHLTAATYGRRAGEGALCDGSKDRPPAQDCLDRGLLPGLRDLCRGLANCSIAVTEGLAELPDCRHQKKELRTNHTCVACAPRAQLVDSPGCVVEALVQGRWATQEDLAALGKAETKQALVAALHKELNSEEHTVEELEGRKVQGGMGGLCGLAALHLALRDTLLSPSQLTALGYVDLREAMGAALGLATKKRKKLDDKALIKKFTKCMFIVFVC